VDAPLSVVPAGCDEALASVDAVVGGEVKEPTFEVGERAFEVKEPITELGVVTAEVTESAIDVGDATGKVTEDAAGEVTEGTTEDAMLVEALSVVPEGADETSPRDPDAVALSVVVADPAADWLVVGPVEDTLLDSPRAGGSVADTDIGAEVDGPPTTVVILTVEVITSSLDDEDRPNLSVVVGNKDDRKPSRSFLSVLVVLASPVDGGGGAGTVVLSTARLICLGK